MDGGLIEYLPHRHGSLFDDDVEQCFPSGVDLILGRPVPLYVASLIN
jgi:hypothetical protein